MAEIDRTTIDRCGVSGLFLMEQAGQCVVNHLLDTLSHEHLQRTAILCGKGNNGGDGLVLARLLSQKGYTPHVALLGNADELKGDARINYSRLLELGIPVHLCLDDEQVTNFFRFTENSLVWIDALLGIGARGAPRGTIATAIAELNQRSTHACLVSIDIPSGIDADTGHVEGVAVFADWVYTLGLPKLGCLLPPGLNHLRNLVVLDIGFPRDVLLHVDPPARLLTVREIDQWLPKRNPSAHKGSEGHLLILAGSKGMTGAALMSAKAAIQMGAGLVTAACPASLLPIYALGVWEMMTKPVPETEEGSFSEEAFPDLFPEASRWKAVVIGPGMGRHPSTQALIRKVVREVSLPLVIDGDSLAAVTKEDLHKRPWPWVATPHPGEMAQLFQIPVSEIQADRLAYAKRLAGCGTGVAVVKGAKTIVAHAKKIPWINPTGSSVMASGGMGDVLTGVIGAWLAKGIPAEFAAASGVFLHGLAAELIAEQTLSEAVTATQVISSLQLALHSTRQWSRMGGSGNHLVRKGYEKTPH